jgi:hypothetical protein
MLMLLEWFEPRANIKSRGFGQLNRRAASGELNDRIKAAWSGMAEWLRRTKPNKSFDRSGNSAAFIRQLGCLVRCVPPGQFQR